MHPYRTHTCGQLRAADAGRAARLSGWVHSKRDHGSLLFIDLRDHDGLTQIVFAAKILARVGQPGVMAGGAVGDRAPCSEFEHTRRVHCPGKFDENVERRTPCGPRIGADRLDGQQIGLIPRLPCDGRRRCRPALPGPAKHPHRPPPQPFTRVEGRITCQVASSFTRRPSTPSAIRPAFSASASAPNTSRRQPCRAGTGGASSVASRSMSSELATRRGAT